MRQRATIRNLAIAFVLAILTAVQLVVHYKNTVDSVELQALRRLQGIATTVAVSLDADQLHRVLLRNSEPTDITDRGQDADYDELFRVLATVERENLLGTPVYTVHRATDGDGFVVGLTSASLPTFRTAYQAPPSLRQDFEHGGVVRANGARGAQHVSAFSPIHNSKNRLVGVVMVDEERAPLLARARWEFAKDALLYTLLVLFAGWLGFVYWNRGDEAEYLQTHDTVTGLPNRSSLVKHLGTAMDTTARTGEPGVALVCVGLDHFRHLNAECGPRAGDEALRVLSRRLQGEAGSQSLVGRIAGDVFAVVQTGIVTSEDASTYAKRLLTVFDEPLHLAEKTVTIRASVGVAMHPVHASEPASLLEAAEEALALAKQRARGQVWVFDEEASVNVKQRKTLAKHLSTAIERNEFFLVYQPKVNRDTKLTGTEALMRWRNPELGLVSPGQFIPIAEATGLIVPMTYWVLTEACEQLLRWNHDNIKMAVNLSLHMFRDPAMVDRLCEIVTRAGIAPNRIELEITETGLMRNPEITLTALTSLKQFGFRLSVDDFGTGYSSLGRLAQMPIDALKVDQSFVRGLDKDFSNAIMVRTIIQLAHSLDLEVVAEGVEEERHLAYLRELGCDKLQGYLFDRPLDPEVFREKWLEDKVEAEGNVLRLLDR